LKCRGLEIAEGGGWQEHAIEAEGKIRFFGGLKGKGEGGKGKGESGQIYLRER
jgi:hypothetical protein